jgi:two-component system sensor histidine kinase AtoS
MKAGAKDYLPKNDRFYEPLAHMVGLVLREDETNRKLEESARQRERLRAQNEISVWMAHNFRNILSGASGYLQLLERTLHEGDIKKSAEYRDEAMVSINKALDLVNQLVSLSDLTPAPSETVVLEDLVEEIVQKVVKNLTTGDGKKPVFDFVNETGKIPPVSLCYRDARGVVLENLICNAVEALDGEHGRIAVSAEIEDGGTLILRIEDNGRGMDEATRQRSLEPLFSTKGTVGSGMGLSLVLAALWRQGGDIVLDSIPGGGTTVTVTWPLDVPCLDE